MTTAHNFPDLSLSPIQDTSEDDIVIDWSSSPLFRAPPNGTLPVIENSSEPIFNVDSVAIDVTDDLVASIQRVHISQGSDIVPQSGSTNYSSEEAFRRLENAICSRFQSEDPEIDIGIHDPEIVTSAVLYGVRVFVDCGHLHSLRSKTTRKLKQMGAVVLRKLNENVSHIVFHRGGSKKTLQTALDMSTQPFLLDTAWVDDCWTEDVRKPEENYSLYGAKFLVDNIRRCSNLSSKRNSVINTSDCIELSPDVVEETVASNEASNHSVELTFDQPMTATQLLTKINTLSRKLDKIAVPHENVTEEKFVSKGTSACSNFIPNSRQVLRRRTHGAHGIEFRAPFSVAAAHTRANRDEKLAVEGISTCADPASNKDINSVEVSGKNAMRKTTVTNLVKMREILASNSQFSNRREHTNVKNKKFPRKILDSPESPFTNPTIRKAANKTPVIKTASNYINDLQCVPSSDEFVSERRTRVRPHNKMGVVFTSVRKVCLQQLKPLAQTLGLRIQTAVTNHTRCVVSGSGTRTLLTMKGVLNNVPIVSPEWITDSSKADKLLSTKDYEFDEWAQLIQERKGSGKMFTRVGKILVAEGCSPSTEHLVSMIKKCGGETTSSIDACSLIVASEEETFHFPWSRRSIPPPIVVCEKYILDCICKNCLLSYNGYIQFVIREDD